LRVDPVHMWFVFEDSISISGRDIEISTDRP